MGDNAGHVLALRRGVVTRGGDAGREEGRGVVLGDVLVGLRSSPLALAAAGGIRLVDDVAVDGLPSPHDGRWKGAGVTEAPHGGGGGAVGEVGLVQRYTMLHLVHCVFGLHIEQ